MVKLQERLERLEHRVVELVALPVVGLVAFRVKLRGARLQVVRLRAIAPIINPISLIAPASAIAPPGR